LPQLAVGVSVLNEIELLASATAGTGDGVGVGVTLAVGIGVIVGVATIVGVGVTSAEGVGVTSVDGVAVTDGKVLFYASFYISVYIDNNQSFQVQCPCIYIGIRIFRFLACQRGE